MSYDEELSGVEKDRVDPIRVMSASLRIASGLTLTLTHDLTCGS